MAKDRTILVVDDDPDLREALSDLLTNEGYQVATASDGVDGLTYLRSHAPPALVLLDWWMPNLNGQGMYEALKRDPVWRAIPVVLVTADAKAAEIARTVGTEGLLTKPVDGDQLIAF